MNTNEFFKTMEDKNFIYKYITSIQEKEWSLIIDNWSNGSVQIKNYLNKYFPQEFGKYSKLGDINVDYLLPYRHNAFWANEDLWRLEYAIKAKLIILGVNGIDEARQLYVTECLRLWLRYDSRRTNLTWTQFRDLVDKCYVDVESDWTNQVNLIRDMCAQYKPKRKQTMYHFREEDFNLINSEMTLSEAYEFWMYYEFPHILDRFKQMKTQEFKAAELNKYGKISSERYEKFKKDLELIKIKEPSLQAFRKLLSRLGIEYKKLF